MSTAGLNLVLFSLGREMWCVLFNLNFRGLTWPKLIYFPSLFTFSIVRSVGIGKIKILEMVGAKQNLKANKTSFTLDIKKCQILGKLENSLIVNAGHRNLNNLKGALPGESDIVFIKRLQKQIEKTMLSPLEITAIMVMISYLLQRKISYCYEFCFLLK